MHLLNVSTFKYMTTHEYYLLSALVNKMKKTKRETKVIYMKKQSKKLYLGGYGGFCY